MLLKLSSDRELLSLKNKRGYILNVNFITKVVKLHLTSCRYCNPNESRRIHVESKIKHRTGETWFADNRIEVNDKASEMIRNKSYEYLSCKRCNP